MDLDTPYRMQSGSQLKERSIVGGLLGQWAGGRIEPWSFANVPSMRQRKELPMEMLRIMSS